MKTQFFSGLLISLSFFFTTNAFAAKTQIRWKINHTPEAYFIHAVDVFKKTVEKKTNGEVTVVADFTGLGSTTSAQLLKQVKDGEVEMAQVYSSDVATSVPAFNVFDLPYLITNHSHANQIFENKIGKSLLSQTTKNGVVGLGFTYSGGFVVRLGKNKIIKKVTDIKGSTIKVLNGRLSSLSMKTLGAHITKDASSDFITATYADLINSFDYKNASPKNFIFNETKDRLLVTVLVMNENFFKRLPSHHRKAVQEAAVIAARAERQNIINSGLKIKKDLLNRNFKVVKLPDSERKAWKLQMKHIYNKFFKEYKAGPQLVRNIQDNQS